MIIELLWVFGSLLALLWVVIPGFCLGLQVRRKRQLRRFQYEIWTEAWQAREARQFGYLEEWWRFGSLVQYPLGMELEQDRFDRQLASLTWSQQRVELKRLAQEKREPEWARVARSERQRLAELERSERLRSAHFLLSIAVHLLPPSERDRYLEEFRAELLDVQRNARLRHARSLLRGVIILRLRRGPTAKAADAAVRRAKN